MIFFYEILFLLTYLLTYLLTLLIIVVTMVTIICNSNNNGCNYNSISHQSSNIELYFAPSWNINVIALFNIYGITSFELILASATIYLNFIQPAAMNRLDVMIFIIINVNNLICFMMTIYIFNILNF